jgi:hypothetical protein
MSPAVATLTRSKIPDASVVNRARPRQHLPLDSAFIAVSETIWRNFN